MTRERQARRWWRLPLILTLLWMVTALPVHGIKRALIETAIFGVIVFGVLYWRRPSPPLIGAVGVDPERRRREDLSMTERHDGRRIVEGEMFGAPVPGRWPGGRTEHE